MPQWIHDRAEHLLAKNPSMPKSQAFAIATQQSHATGHSPKDYGTAQGKRTARAKFSTPKGDEQRANPGKLDSPKLASLAESLVRAGKLLPESVIAPQIRAGEQQFTKHMSSRLSPRAKAMFAETPMGRAGTPPSAMAQLAGTSDMDAQRALMSIWDRTTPVHVAAPKLAFSLSPEARKKALEAAKGELGPAVGAVLGAGTAGALGINPLAGAAAGYGLGAIPEVVHAIRHRGVEEVGAPAHLQKLVTPVPKVASAAFIEKMSSILAKRAEALTGGKADGKKDKDFDAKQLAMGAKVEREHTDNPTVAHEIARDHLTEIGDYYTRLKKMEAGAEKSAGLLELLKTPIPGTPELLMRAKDPALITTGKEALRGLRPQAQRTVSRGGVTSIDPALADRILGKVASQLVKTARLIEGAGSCPKAEAVKAKKSSAEESYSLDSMQWADGGPMKTSSVKEALAPMPVPQAAPQPTPPVGKKPLSTGALAGIGAGIGALGVGAGVLGTRLLANRGRGAGAAVQQAARALPAAVRKPAADPFAATRMTTGDASYFQRGLEALDPGTRKALQQRAAQMGHGMDEGAAYQLMHMGASETGMPMSEYIKHELAGTAVGVPTPKVPSIVSQAKQQALASMPAPELPAQSLSALRNSSFVKSRMEGGMSEAEALHRGMNDYYRRMQSAVAAGEIDPKQVRLHDYIAKVGSSFSDEMYKIGKYLAEQLSKPKVRAVSVAPPDPKFSVKQAMIPTTTTPIGSSMETPEKRLAKAQKVGTPDDPNGMKYKPLNMVQPPKLSSMSKVALDFATSDFAGGQLYPGPRSLSLPISGQMPASAVARDPQLKYGGPPGDKPKEKKANVISPERQLSSSRTAGERSLTQPGMSAGNSAKPIGYGKPMFAKDWANRNHVA